MSVSKSVTVKIDGVYFKEFTDAEGTRKRVKLPPHQQEKLKNAADLKRNFGRGVTVGTGIAVADIATGAIVTTEVIAAVPTIVTVAALGGLCYLGYKAFGGK
jgi:hypothetical protein